MLEEVLPLRRASRELIRELGFLEEEASPGGITHSQVHALIELEGRGPLPQVDLASALRLDKSRMSRVVDQLCAEAWVKRVEGVADARKRVVCITAKGKKRLAIVHADASARVGSALSLLSPEERRSVVDGMALYANALARSRRRAEYVVRPVAESDCVGVARLIRTVMPEFGAKGPGYAISDPEVDDMYSAYTADGPRAAYWVVARASDGKVAGAGGFAPLVGGGKRTCELRKMYFYPELRGLGLGSELLSMCLERAAKAGFSRMYLETLTPMTQARTLYEKHGFERLAAPLGNTGHGGCDVFYARALPTNKKKRA